MTRFPLFLIVCSLAYGCESDGVYPEEKRLSLSGLGNTSFGPDLTSPGAPPRNGSLRSLPQSPVREPHKEEKTSPSIAVPPELVALLENSAFLRILANQELIDILLAHSLELDKAVGFLKKGFPPLFPEQSLFKME